MHAVLNAIVMHVMSRDLCEHFSEMAKHKQRKISGTCSACCEESLSEQFLHCLAGMLELHLLAQHLFRCPCHPILLCTTSILPSAGDVYQDFVACASSATGSIGLPDIPLSHSVLLSVCIVVEDTMDKPEL